MRGAGSPAGSRCPGRSISAGWPAAPEAIARTQQNPVHLYQRPDGPLEFDSTRTSLSGTNLELRFAKVGGKRLRFETAYQRRTPGFEINDVGFLRQADQQAWTTWATLAFRNPNRVFRELRWNFNNWEYWSIAGLPTERAFNTNVHTQFNNRWWLHMGGTLGQLGTTYCDRCARGGPAIRQDAYIAPGLGIEGDDRKPLVPTFWVNYWCGDGGRSETISAGADARAQGVHPVHHLTQRQLRAQPQRHPVLRHLHRSGRGRRTYTFAHLEQETLSLTWRLGYTFTPNTSLQVYASPFVSKGTYSDVREVGEARAEAYDARYQPYADPAVAGDPGRVQRAGVPLQRRVPLGVPAGLDAVPGVESGAGGLRGGRRGPSRFGAIWAISSVSARTIRSW